MTDTRYERIAQDRDPHMDDDDMDGDADINEHNGTHIGNGEPRVEITKSNDAKNQFGQAIVVVLGLIFIYFILSIGLTFYQRWLLKKFKFPLLIVSYHLIIKLIMSAVIRIIYRLITGRSRVSIDFRTSAKKIAPTGLASGLDIGFSNWGLELVTISLYTMTKSTTIIFIMIFAIFLGLEKTSRSLMGIVVMISGGLFMFTYKSTQFDALGFWFLIFASLSSGIRWSFAQLIMQKSKLGLHNPVDMVFHMQPWMLLSILPFTIGFEGKRIFEGLATISEVPTEEITLMCLKVSVGAVIAFVMELSEFLVLSYTSSLTLSVAGIFKEVCQLVLAVEINGDQLSVMNLLGLVMCLGGIVMHVRQKYVAAKSKDVSVMSSISTFDKSHTVSYSSGGSTSGNGTSGGGVGLLKTTRTGQTIPLLDSDDLGDSDSDTLPPNHQNASDVIFDVLKRRDNRR